MIPFRMNTTPSVIQDSYGTLPDGREVSIFTLTNRNGLRARVSNFGALLISVETPDRTGKLADITHGFDTLEGWLVNGPYFGASVGRFGNRIAHGKFTLNGKEYSLATNNDPGGIPCHLHGGIEGFTKKLWSAEITGPQSVAFSYTSPDGEEGYPGTLTTTITYTLNDNDELIWHATATTDAPTIVNIIHHSYWNLSGNPETKILDHELTIFADHYLPTNPGLIPTGEIAPVAGTPMDFNTPHLIGERIHDDFEALTIGEGYDHCWVLSPSKSIRHATTLKDPKTGRVMEIHTDQPGIQVYTAFYLDGVTPGKGNVPYASESAIALETEGFPDSPNQPHFPSPVLNPGETYSHTLIHKFRVD